MEAAYSTLHELCPEPSSGPDPRQDKMKYVKKKQIQAGTTKTARDKKRAPKPPEDTNFKIISLAFIALGIIGLSVIIVIATTVPPPTAEQLSCQRLQGDNPSTSLFDVNNCAKASCAFDVTLCTEQCSFGFETDPNTECPINCQCASKGVFEGDIAFDEEDLEELLQHYADPNRDRTFTVFQSAAVDARWSKLPNGRVQVYYQVADDLSAITIHNVYEASRQFSEKSCIDLTPLPEKFGPVPRGGIPHVSITLGKGCYVLGGVGKQGDHVHFMSLGHGCEVVATVVHEFLHLLGFWHEQSRADRDGFVDIFYDNIFQGDRHNFQKQEQSAVEDYGFEYDFDSVLHYPSTAFAGAGEYSVLKKDGSVIEDLREVSEIDWAELNAYYDCGDVRNFKQDGEWTEWGITSTCVSVCGEGVKTRFRRCVNADGEFAFGCPGKAALVEVCKNDKCVGREILTGPWTPCDKPCFGGYRFRNIKCDPRGACPRDCYNVPQACNSEFECDTEQDEYDRRGIWTEWNKWSDSCDHRSCLPNTRFRRRSRWCVDERYVATTLCDWSTTFLPASGNYSELHESGNQAHVEFCLCDRFEEEGWNWETWSECSATCGGTRFSDDVGLYVCAGREPCSACPLSVVLRHNSTIIIIRRRCSTIDFKCGEPGDGDGKTGAQTVQCGRRSCVPVDRGVLGEIWRSKDRRCLYGRYYTGFFNNDKIKDLLCYYPDGWVRLYFASDRGIYLGLSWEGPTPICRFMYNEGRYASVAVGDIDGDGLDDLLCHHASLSRIDVALNKNGEFRNVTDWSGINTFCSLRHHKVRLLDINGDNRADLVCGDHRIALKRILMNTIDPTLYE